ncbi:MAG TPA: copper-binding protein [Pseudolabrys sp.]
MKLHTLAVLGALTLPVALTPASVVAQTDDFVSGQVTKVDEPAGKITIKHGPLKKFDMDEGMTMVFRAGDPAMLKMVKAGDKIRFVPDRVNGQFTVMKIEK